MEPNTTKLSKSRELVCPDAQKPIRHRFLALILDWLMRPFQKYRAGVVSRATGRVLEVGVGTGLNLPLYKSIEHLWAVEPDPHMLLRAEKKASCCGFPVSFRQAGAEELPFDDDYFDTVVITWVLCSVHDPRKALMEVRRVLKKGGKAIFAEHVKNERKWAGWLQRWITPGWRRLAGNCHLDRNPIPFFKELGFIIDEISHHGKRGMGLIPTITGSARKT